MATNPAKKALFGFVVIPARPILAIALFTITARAVVFLTGIAVITLIP